MIAGLGGVFVGMALLYAAIRITSIVADRWVRQEEQK
jgi:hypothetical protein